MTDPICPECLRLGNYHPKYALLDQPHIVVITKDGECPACGLRVTEDIVWCRVCKVAVATETGQLCEGCAGAVGAYEVTQTEIDRLSPLVETGVLCGTRADPAGAVDHEAAAEDYFGW